MNRRLFSLMLLLPAVSLAADPEPITDSVPPPPVVQSGEALEPEVTIKQEGKETIYEYRVNGRLTLVRVIPPFGAPYYFVDSDGDGELDMRREGPVNDSVNQWILFRW
jgi:hypothetical protein